MGFSDIFKTIKERFIQQAATVEDKKSFNNIDSPKQEMPMINVEELFIEPTIPQPKAAEFTLDELRILHYRSRIFRKNDPLPEYLKEYTSVINKLYGKGYFCNVDASTYFKQKTKVPELKEYLKQNNLPVSGNKDALIQRIIDNVDNDKIYSDFDISEYYSLSDKGRKIVNKYPRDYYNEATTYEDLRNAAIYLCKYLNKNILTDNLQFVSQNIKFLENYSKYDVTIKVFILSYEQCCKNLDFVKNQEHNQCSKIFEMLYNTEIPDNVFMQIEKYYHSFKELQKIKKTLSESKYKIECMNDQRTCTFCKKAQNKQYTYGEAIIGINYPPFYGCKNDFCKCFASYAFDDE